MSQEPNQMNTGRSQPRNNSMIYWIIIGVLLIACIYMFVSKNKLADQNTQTTAQLATADSSRNAVETDYNAALARLDQLTSKNSQMDSMINAKDGDISKLKSQIHSILSDKKATAAQIAQAKELIATLNDKVKSYEERIAELEKENGNLNNQNTTLTKERDSTVTQNIALKQVGSVLHASNIRMTPLHVRKNGKEKETEKAKRVDVIKIQFDIDENRIAESGTKDLYLRIIAPGGAVVSDALIGSGNTTMSDGSSINYTMMKQVPLQKGEPVKDVSVDWKQMGDYKRGTYTIEIYNSGYKVGSGSVSLR